MGWRKNMAAGREKLNSTPPIQKVQNIQKVEKKDKNKTFVPSVAFVDKGQNIKSLQNQMHDSNAPWQKRAKYVPQFQKMSAKTNRMNASIATSAVEKKAPLSWQDTPRLPPEDNPIESEDCPARCKRTGKCYGVVYFTGKPGKAEHCSDKRCQWVGQLKQYHINEFPRRKRTGYQQRI